MNDQVRHLWRRQRVLPQEQRYRNTLFPREERRYVGGGIRWWFVITVLVFLSGIGAAIWSPILAISYVAVNGTSSADASVIRKAADDFLNGRALGIFPRRSFLIASPQGLASSVQKALREEPSVTAVSADKTFPFLATITVTEQMPNVVYTNSGIRYLLNRDGMVVSQVNGGEKVPKRYPQLYDQTSRPVAVGSRIVRKATIDALFVASERIAELTDVAIAFYFLPPAECPKPDEQSEEGEGGEGSNTNVNVNPKKNAPASSKNSSTSEKKGGADAHTNSSPIVAVCNLGEVVQKSVELHARTSEKWDIFMRVDQPVEDQIVRLGRVLNETKPDRKKLHSIDVRFGENVIVR